MDHEKHEMSETRETVNVAMDQMIPRLVGDIACGRVEEEKSTMLPQANRASIGQTSGLNNRPRNSCQ
ncbi:MAG: hypothetical protein ACLFVO_14425 [Chloroflexaceae bacterium]